MGQETEEESVSGIQKVGVVGCGLMGRGIAQVCAAAGYETIVREVNRELLETGLGAIGKQLDRAVEKGKLEAEVRDATLGRLSGTVSLEDLADCDLIIEAIVENIEAKKDLLGVLDRQSPEHTIFASNTSSLTVTEMGAATDRPDRFVGLHFFNPVPIMKLVEVEYDCAECSDRICDTIHLQPTDLDFLSVPGALKSGRQTGVPRPIRQPGFDPEYFLAEAHQLPVRGAAKRPEDLEIVDRLEQVRLPGAVRSYDNRSRLRELAPQLPEVPEITQMQALETRRSGLGRSSSGSARGRQHRLWKIQRNPG
jgi:hypothetical protein